MKRADRFFLAVLSPRSRRGFVGRHEGLEPGRGLPEVNDLAALVHDPHPPRLAQGRGDGRHDLDDADGVPGRLDCAKQGSKGRRVAGSPGSGLASSRGAIPSQSPQ